LSNNFFFQKNNHIKLNGSRLLPDLAGKGGTYRVCHH